MLGAKKIGAFAAKIGLLATTGMVRDITQERGLWEPSFRNVLTGRNDIASGLLLVLFGLLAVSPRFAWAQWATTAVGLWLLFAPLFFWTASAAAYTNDTVIGALAIIFSVLVPMMPGMSHEGMRPAGLTRPRRGCSAVRKECLCSHPSCVRAR